MGLFLAVVREFAEKGLLLPRYALYDDPLGTNKALTWNNAVPEEVAPAGPGAAGPGEAGRASVAPSTWMSHVHAMCSLSTVDTDAYARRARPRKTYSSLVQGVPCSGKYMLLPLGCGPRGGGVRRWLSSSLRIVKSVDAC